MLVDLLNGMDASAVVLVGDIGDQPVTDVAIGKLKPLLTQDKWMPAAVRRAIHEAADELWADVML